MSTKVVALSLASIGTVANITKHGLKALGRNKEAKIISFLGLDTLVKQGATLYIASFFSFKIIFVYALIIAIIKTYAQQKGIEIVYIEY